MVRVAVVYLAFAWLIIQVASIILPAFAASPWMFQALIIAFILGFPIVSVLVWTYEWTTKGIKRDEGKVLPEALEKLQGRKLDFVIIGALVLALSASVVERFLHSGQNSPLVDSIAVLPLANLSGDPDQEYFTDGMTEALITKLSQIAALKVISRTSVMKYKDSDLGLQQIATALGVEAILQGSAIYDQSRVRITAQLIDAETDQHLWAESYDRDMVDILALQSEVALSVAKEVALVMTPDEQSRLSVNRKVNRENYEDYLRGMYYINQGTPEGFEKGLAFLHGAVERDPGDPLAYAGLALGYTRMTHQPSPPAESMNKALAAALRALKLDPQLSEVWHALGNIKLYHEWDFSGAEQALLRALELEPNSAEAHYDYAWYLVLVGQMEQAVIEHKMAAELDPLDLKNIVFLGGVYLRKGDYENALATVKSVLEVNPNYARGYIVLGGVYLAKGMHKEAIEAHKKMVSLVPTYKWILGVTYAKAGYKPEALEIVAALEEESKNPKAGWPPLALGRIQFYLGNYDQAAYWLTRGPFHAWLPWTMHDPEIKARLSVYPEYLEVLNRMPLPVKTEAQN